MRYQDLVGFLLLIYVFSLHLISGFSFALPSIFDIALTWFILFRFSSFSYHFTLSFFFIPYGYGLCLVYFVYLLLLCLKMRLAMGAWIGVYFFVYLSDWRGLLNNIYVLCFKST